jgi:hypothetical protein
MTELRARMATRAITPFHLWIKCSELGGVNLAFIEHDAYLCEALKAPDIVMTMISHAVWELESFP